MSDKIDIADQMEDLGACLRSLQTLIGCVGNPASRSHAPAWECLP